MSQENEPATIDDWDDEVELTDESVARHLMRHPDFLAQRPDVLAAIVPPVRWSGDTVVDLQRSIVDALRGEIDGLRTCAETVIETSRSNLSSQSRVHAAVLALLEHEDRAARVRVIADEWPDLLAVDTVALLVESTRRNSTAVAPFRYVSVGTADRLLGAGQPVALLRDFTDDGGVFGPAAELVRSAALARLRTRDGETVILALGAREPEMFQPGQGTELLSFLARVSERCLNGTTGPAT